MEKNRKNFISDYEIIETIWETPEGSLYKAVKESSANNVLIKVSFPSLEWTDAILNEFIDRISYLQFIEHEDLLPILDMGQHEKVPYVVYPYFSGDVFEDRKFQQLTEKEILDLFYEIADALDFLHKQEIFHGMLSARNILIDAAGRPKLFDYGLTEILKKLFLENTADGFGNLSISNVDFTSPEQLLGRNPTRQSDIYSFGVLLFFSLVGEFPFNSSLVPEVAAWHLNQGVTQIATESGRISRHTLRFMQKCMQVESGDRFPNFLEVLRVLDRTRRGKRTGFSFSERFKLVKSRDRSRRAWVYVIPVLVFLGLVSWLYIQNTTVQNEPSAFPSMSGATVTQFATPTRSIVAAATLAPEEQLGPEGTLVPQPIPMEVAAYRPSIEGEKTEVLTEKISLTNVDKVRELTRLGYGKPEQADISPSLRYFVLATSAGVFIYEGNQLSAWIDPLGWATAVQFSPDEKSLVIGLDSGEIQLWDWAKGERTSTLSGHTARISKILFSSNGRFMYSASFDQHVIVWNGTSYEVVRNIPAHSGPVNDIVVSSDARTLITGSDDQLVRIWDLAAGTKIYEFRFPGKVQALALSSDDAFLAVGGESGLIRQVNVRTQQLRTDPIPVQERIWSLQYIEGDSKLLAGIDGGQTRIYDASQLRHDGISLLFQIDPVSLPLVKILGFGFEFNSSAISPGRGQNIITIRWDGVVNKDGIDILEPFYDSLDRLDFSEDGTVLAASGGLGSTSVWDIPENIILYRDKVRLPPGDPISPNGQSMVVETESSYRLVSLATGPTSRHFSETIPGGVISYANQGSILISGNLRESKVWDFKSGYETFFSYHPQTGCLITLSANNQEILQVNSAAGVVPSWREDTKSFCAKSFVYASSLSALSADMGLFIYRSSNGFVEGFDPVQNTVLWKYPPESKVTALAVSSDGSIVVIGDESGKLFLLDGGNGKLLAELKGNFGSVKVIEFSHDDMKIATAGSDGAVRIFGVVNQ